MGTDGTSVLVRTTAPAGESAEHNVQLPAYDRQRLEDVGFLTAMTLTLLGNYAQTGHFGGPLAYTPYNVALHLVGPEHGGLRYDYRRPKHPFGDKLLVAGGHNIPTLYALWMIMARRWPAATSRPVMAATRSIPRSPCCRSTAWASGAERGRWRRCSRTTAWPTTRCSHRPSCAASARSPGTRRPPISSTT